MTYQAGSAIRVWFLADKQIEIEAELIMDNVFEAKTLETKIRQLLNQKTEHSER